jgi:hypothetical protein
MSTESDLDDSLPDWLHAQLTGGPAPPIGADLADRVAIQVIRRRWARLSTAALVIAAAVAVPVFLTRGGGAPAVGPGAITSITSTGSVSPTTPVAPSPDTSSLLASKAALQPSSTSPSEPGEFIDDSTGIDSYLPPDGAMPRLTADKAEALVRTTSVIGYVRTTAPSSVELRYVAFRKFPGEKGTPPQLAWHLTYLDALNLIPDRNVKTITCTLDLYLTDDTGKVASLTESCPTTR